MIVETDEKATLAKSKLERGADQQREPERLIGEIMKDKFAKVLFTLICFLVFGLTAEADIRGQISVTLPFEFVVDGETLPPGTYTLSTFTDDKFDGLILSNYDHQISVFVHPVEIKGAAADKPRVSFQRVGNQLFLTRIQTAYDVYNIAVPHSAIIEYAEKSRGDGASSGNSAGN
jgi:hypothetical protein